MGEFLVRWKFDFLVWKWLKCLILVDFDDMEYDKGFEMRKFEILLDFVGNFEDWGDVGFFSWLYRTLPRNEWYVF